MPSTINPIPVRVVKRRKALRGLVMLVLAGVVGALMLACQGPPAGRHPVPASTEDDYSQWAPCQHEDGSGDGQVYPCVWDADTRGNGLRGAHSPRWTVFVRSEDGCPPQVNVDGQSACVFAVEWSAEAGD